MLLSISETWKSSEAEIWESHYGHIYMGAGRFENKHSVGSICGQKIHWTEYINERAIATLVDVNRKKVMRTSVHGVTFCIIGIHLLVARSAF